MARDPMINTATGQRRVIRKKGDLTTGKGDWLRIGLNCTMRLTLRMEWSFNMPIG